MVVMWGLWLVVHGGGDCGRYLWLVVQSGGDCGWWCIVVVIVGGDVMIVVGGA